MKTRNIVWLSLVLSLLLVACGADDTLSAIDQDTVDDIYTQAALTLSAQAPLPTNTVQATPSLIPTAVVLPTSLSLSTPTANLISYSSSSNSTGCDNAVYLSDVTIPDGTILIPDETFTKTWSMQNSGSCEWTTSYSIVFYSGNVMSGSTTLLSDTVPAGGSTNVSVEMTAPTTAGSYTGYWRLQNASGASFGEAVYVQIVVSGSTSTPTATSTAASEEEATGTPTSTTVPTSTTEPTSTNTPEATVTETPSS